MEPNVDKMDGEGEKGVGLARGHADWTNGRTGGGGGEQSSNGEEIAAQGLRVRGGCVCRTLLQQELLFRPLEEYDLHTLAARKIPPL